jgi:hypothetical protein
VGAVFCVGRSASGAPPVAAEAPPASDNKPAAPNTGTAFAPRFRFSFAFAIVRSSRSIPWVGIVVEYSQPLERTLGSVAKQARTELADDTGVSFSVPTVDGETSNV